MAPFSETGGKGRGKKGGQRAQSQVNLLIEVRTHIMSRSSRIVVDLARQATANGVQW
jgi:hypothetical protein